MPDSDGIVALPKYCPRGQATRCFGPHRTVTCTEQGVQEEDKGLVPKYLQGFQGLGWRTERPRYGGDK